MNSNSEESKDKTPVATMKKCPYCAEEIQDAAVKCRYCLEWLEPKERPSAPLQESAGSKEISSWDEYCLLFQRLEPDEQQAEWEKLSFRQQERLCRLGLQPPAPTQPRTTVFARYADRKSKVPMLVSPRQIMAFVGCALLIGGVFAPLVHAPVIGSVSYMASGSGDGVFLICIALLAFLIARRRALNWLWLPILMAVGLMAFTYLRLAEGGVLLQFQWGWAVLGLGLVLLVAAAVGSAIFGD